MAETGRVRSWLFTTITTDAALLALTPTIADRLYNGVAPPGAAFPFGVMQLLSGGNDLMALGGIRIWADMLWLIKVIARSKSEQIPKSGSIEPIVDRIDALLHAKSGTVTNGVIWECVRERPFELPTVERGVGYVQMGAEWRIKASKA